MRLLPALSRDGKSIFVEPLSHHLGKSLFLDEARCEMMDRGLIFDMDGVILDSEIRYFEAHKKMFEELSVTIPHAQYATFMGKTGDEMWVEIIEGNGLPHTAEELLEIEHEMFQHYAKAEECGIKDGVRQLIANAKEAGFKVAIASSSAKEKIERVIRHYGLDVEIYTSGFEVPRSKPDPAIFRLTAERLGVSPERCIVIEDAANGMIGAKRAGMEVIALLDDRMPKQLLDHADHQANSHDEIWKILSSR